MLFFVTLSAMHLYIDYGNLHSLSPHHLNPLNPKLPFGNIILRTAHARWFCVSRKGGTGGGGWGHPQGDMHMVAAGLGCESAMVGTVWANFCPGCMDRL